MGAEVVVGLSTFLGYLFTLLLVPWVLLTKKRWPASTVAWLMAIVTLPVIGGVLYLLFGIDRLKKRVSQHRSRRETMHRLRPVQGWSGWHTHEGFHDSLLRLVRVAKVVCETTPTFGNAFQLYHETSVAFAEIRTALEAAEQSIHLEYYIWQPDRLGTELRDLLIKKAQQGIAVRFLYDSVGSLRLTRAFLAPMREAGIEVSAFSPGRTWRDRWSFNFRNHRKIIVIDGKIGFTGGMNVGDEYLGLSEHFGYWRDTHLRMEGPAVLQLQHVFVTDWYSATGEELTDDILFPAPVDAGTIVAQVVSGGPDCEPSVFHSLMFSAIGEAKHTVTLETSYFVPTPSLCAALISAAQSGVRTRVMVSGPVTYWTTYHACRSFYDELLQAGVEIYEYRRGQLHSKTLTIDGHWSLVGTPNFDPRSVYLNFEVAVAIYDQGVAVQLEEQFDTDINDTVRIDPAEWVQRSMWEQLKENSCRMFVPVL
ncbi:cardiolipin synthase [bacterium]|nr:cardiolipin synthase [bacterium]